MTDLTAAFNTSYHFYLQVDMIYRDKSVGNLIRISVVKLVLLKAGIIIANFQMLNVKSVIYSIKVFSKFNPGSGL